MVKYFTHFSILPCLHVWLSNDNLMTDTFFYIQGCGHMETQGDNPKNNPFHPNYHPNSDLKSPVQGN